MPHNPNDLDPAQLDEIHRDIQKDLANGNGEKHFQDVLDELHSTQGSSSVTETEDQRAELIRFYASLRSALEEQIKSQGFRCIRVQSDGEGQGFICYFVDRDRRPFDVQYSFHQGLRAAAQQGQGYMGRAIITEILDQLLEARAKYFARMG